MYQTKVSSPQDWAGLARSLAPLIEAEIETSEAARTLSPAVVDALRQTGLFWMMVPREVGGGGGSLRNHIEVIAELSYADCSAGWSFMANTGGTCAAAAFCGDTAIDAMFGGSRMAIVAGQLGPNGKGIRVDGGLKAAGQFSYGSGIGHADWVGGGMFVMENGSPRMFPHGPEVQCCMLPKDKIKLADNWNVTGLMATGSFDYEIPEQVFTEDFMFERALAPRKRGQALFNLGMMPVVAAGHIGVVLGAMKRALHETARYAAEKKRVGYPGLIADYPTFQDDFSRQEIAYMSARDYAFRVFDEVEAMADAGLKPSDYQFARIRQSTSWIHAVAGDVVRACHDWTSSEGFRGSTPIIRAFRDVFVATNHLFVDPVHLVHSGKAIIEHYRQGCPEEPQLEACS